MEDLDMESQQTEFWTSSQSVDIQYNRECNHDEILSDAGNQSSCKKRTTRKITTPRVKWTERMERSVLEYIHYNFIAGQNFEKPSAPEYYRNFLKDAVGFNDVSLDKLVQHMKNLKKYYLNAVEWRNSTSQGEIDSQIEDDPATVETELLRRCKYFRELDEVLGSKLQINPVYVNYAASTTSPVEEIVESQKLENIEELDSDEHIIDPLMDENLQDRINDSSERKSPEWTKRPTPVKHSFILKRKFRSSPIISAVGALESAMRDRIATEENRLTWEKEWKANELVEQKQLKTAELDLKRARLNFEREKWQQEFEQKKQFEDRKYEIEKLKVEKDAELSKLKIEREFELEKFRIQSMGK